MTGIADDRCQVALLGRDCGNPDARAFEGMCVHEHRDTARVCDIHVRWHEAGDVPLLCEACCYAGHRCVLAIREMTVPAGRTGT